MLNHRDEQEMLNLILDVAKKDDRIRAVIMNGSRTSPAACKDIFQDYDIVYLVTDVKAFVDDKHWIKQFGDILIMQLPDVMDDKWPTNQDEFAYLVQFKDWNRIDFSLLHVSRLSTMPRDSQSILLLDKDHHITKYDPPSDRDYLPKPPSNKAFQDCCNEFLWVATYVAKGIWRKQLTYSKYMSEQIVKEQLMKMLIWYAGMQTSFQQTMGHCGKYLENYLESGLWNKFTKTYVDADYQNMWNALFLMFEIFNEVAVLVAENFNYDYNQQEYEAVLCYITSVANFNSV